MIRRLCNILCGLSLLLCVATSWLWISSYFVLHYVGYSFEDTAHPSISDDYMSLHWSGGGMVFECVPAMIRSIVTPPGFRWGVSSSKTDIHYPSPPTNSPRWLMKVIGIGWGSYLGPYSIRSLIFPAWIPVILTAVLPTVWLIRPRGSRRPPLGFCQNCGYNLTGNVSGICPECGTAITVGDRDQ